MLLGTLTIKISWSVFSFFVSIRNIDPMLINMGTSFMKELQIFDLLEVKSYGSHSSWTESLFWNGDHLDYKNYHLSYYGENVK